MKKLLVLTLLATTLVSTPVQAKTIMVPQEICSEEFLTVYKDDTVYAYFYGTRMARNGDGEDIDGYYVRYPKGRPGQKFTTIVRYNNGATDFDDFDERIDLKGWVKPTVK